MGFISAYARINTIGFYSLYLFSTFLQVRKVAPRSLLSTVFASQSWIWLFLRIFNWRRRLLLQRLLHPTYIRRKISLWLRLLQWNRGWFQRKWNLLNVSLPRRCEVIDCRSSKKSCQKSWARKLISEIAHSWTNRVLALVVAHAKLAQFLARITKLRFLLGNFNFKSILRMKLGNFLSCARNFASLACSTTCAVLLFALKWGTLKIILQLSHQSILFVPSLSISTLSSWSTKELLRLIS